MDYTQSVNYLNELGHEVLAAKFNLENIKILLERLDNPEQAYPSIIVAGTNGKGSVSAMLESVLREAGYRSALYTSPHLIRLEERIKIRGEEITQKDFAGIASLIREVSETLVAEKKLATVPTFFEQVTAIALMHFKEKRAELAVLEVGLGGRLDATNAVPRMVSVVTAIDFDHQNILGHDIKQISAEKSAVIIEGVSAVIGRQYYADAYEVLTRRSMSVGVEPVFVNEPTDVSLTEYGLPVFDYESRHTRYQQISSGLCGRHQAENAATAIEAAEAISQKGFAISREAIIRGLRTVEWEGRLELIEGNPAFLLDGAHNPSGAKVLGSFLKEFWNRHLTLIFGAMSDKDIQGIAEELFPLAQVVIFTKVEDERAASMDKMDAAIWFTNGEIFSTFSVEQAISTALEHTPPGGLICVAGSLYLVGAVKTYIQKH
jgi:dihydrofolate synthase / folylpolyglutamate synthase